MNTMPSQRNFRNAAESIIGEKATRTKKFARGAALATLATVSLGATNEKTLAPALLAAPVIGGVAYVERKKSLSGIAETIDAYRQSQGVSVPEMRKALEAPHITVPSAVASTLAENTMMAVGGTLTTVSFSQSENLANVGLAAQMGVFSVGLGALAIGIDAFYMRPESFQFQLNAVDNIRSTAPAQ